MAVYYSPIRRWPVAENTRKNCRDGCWVIAISCQLWFPFIPRLFGESAVMHKVPNSRINSLQSSAALILWQEWTWHSYGIIDPCTCLWVLTWMGTTSPPRSSSMVAWRSSIQSSQVSAVAYFEYPDLLAMVS